MIRLTEKEPVYLELYEALAHFLGRQQLVVRAVIEQGVSPQALAAGVAGWHDKTPQTGAWGAEWRFMFHGSGCELKHNRTGEPIDWNGPDPHAFGARAFARHLAWRLAQGHPLPLLRALFNREGEAAILRLIDELIAGEIISSDRRLITDSDRAEANAA